MTPPQNVEVPWLSAAGVGCFGDGHRQVTKDVGSDHPGTVRLSSTCRLTVAGEGLVTTVRWRGIGRTTSLPTPQPSFRGRQRRRAEGDFAGAAGQSAPAAGHSSPSSTTAVRGTPSSPYSMPTVACCESTRQPVAASRYRLTQGATQLDPYIPVPSWLAEAYRNVAVTGATPLRSPTA